MLLGIHAGFYANWLALIIGYLSFLFVFRFLRLSGKLNLIVYSALIILLLFVHIYTWTVLGIVTVLFLIIMHKVNHYTRRKVLLLLLVTLSAIAIDLGRMGLTGTSSGIGQDLGIAQTGLGIQQFLMHWSSLNDTVHIYYGSIFGNFILLILGMYWVFRCDLGEPYNMFLMVFLSIAIIPLLLGDRIVRSRVLYEIPFQIPSAIALTNIKKWQPNRTLICIAICIWLFATSILIVSLS